jgi:hypothetical protein
MLCIVSSRRDASPLANDTLATAPPTPRTARSAAEEAWPRMPAEFVILFARSDLVPKTRIRPAG